MVVFRKIDAIMNNKLKIVMIAAMAVIWAAGTAQAGYKFQINDAVKGERFLDTGLVSICGKCQ